jgi:glycosyltransferase involved in cell wall biosynthesis
MTVGMLRVRNEARWIGRSILSILPLCDRVLVLDDHSGDGTPRICAGLPKVEVIDSPFTGTDEVRDKNFLLERAGGASWIIAIDGDEVLAPGDLAQVSEAMAGSARCISMRVPYLWDSESQVRMDGVYGEFRRHSVFRPRPGMRFESTIASGFHCGNVPLRLRSGALTIPARLLHYGYMQREDRQRKYCWYNAKDPGNGGEDRYRHIAAGLATPHAELMLEQQRIRRESGLAELRSDQWIPPAPSLLERTAHGGPVRLEQLEDLSK